jgi:hypothetical protein
MKRFLFTGIVALWGAYAALGQPLAGYTNSAPFIALGPPIDAISFVNLATFEPLIFGPSPFDFTDCSFFTNKSTMFCSLGFKFDTVTNVQGTIQRLPAQSFNNGNTGAIFAGGILTKAQFVGIGIGTELPEIIVNATNMVNTGVLDTDVTGVINLTGKTVNLSRGTIHVEGFDNGTSVTDPLTLGTNSVASVGVFDQIFGLGLQSNLLSVLNFTLPNPVTPQTKATNILGTQELVTFSPPNATPFVFTNMVNPSNVTIQVVLINTNLPGIGTDVRFAPGEVMSIPTIEWFAVVTNGAGQTLSTNTLFLQDAFGSHPTNLMVTNNFSFSGSAELAPYNYTFTRSLPGFTNFQQANFAPYTTALFDNAFPTTNVYSFWQVALQPVAFAPDPTTPSAPLTNLPGRLIINSTGPGSTLDLRNATIDGPNYMSISATNHFIGAQGASITAANMDINLGTTNGTLTISGLVAPSVGRFAGTIDLYSARWTNVFTNITATSTNVLTNEFHILMVLADLQPSAPVIIQHVGLRSTNVFIDDVLSVTNGLFIDAQNLTIDTNSLNAVNPTGELILLNETNILWPASAPTLQNLTNWGSLFSANGLDFIDQSGAPYKTWVNHGNIFAGSISVTAAEIENIGEGGTALQFGGEIVTNETDATIFSTGGTVTLHASNAVLVAGSISTPGDISITAGSLTISNHILDATGTLSFTLTNTLNDGGTASSNSWAPGNGINLFQRAKVGDFLGTTVLLTAPPHLEVDNTWDGADVGPVPAGFLNNGALGHLIVDGKDSVSAFLFQGPDSVNPYALYVDELEMREGATNRVVIDGAEAFTAFDLPPNFNIYFADAIIQGSDISEKLNGAFGLNGAEGGQLIWVPSFAGIFSSTNITFPNGITYQFNRALKESRDIFSNGSTANFATQFPFNVNLTMVHSNNPALNVLSWYAPANATNHLFVTTNPTNKNWISLTNFVQGSGAGQVTVMDAGRTNSTSFYKVQISPVQP